MLTRAAALVLMILLVGGMHHRRIPPLELDVRAERGDGDDGAWHGSAMVAFRATGVAVISLRLVRDDGATLELRGNGTGAPDVRAGTVRIVARSEILRDGGLADSEAITRAVIDPERESLSIEVKSAGVSLRFRHVKIAVERA